MLCRCGFNFSDEKECGFETYAVVQDEDYRKFLKAEMKAVACKSGDSRLAAIAHASQYVGTAYACPACDRLTLLLPAGRGELRYALEERDVTE
jgi:hypothetical protein